MCENAGSKPDSFGGYVIQVPRALYYLVCGYTYVCIEKHDDISVLDEDKNVLIVEQVKDKESASFSDHSKDFWGTFSNWTDNYIKDNTKFTHKTEYILFSNKRKKLNPNSFILKCHNAKNDEEALETLNFIISNFKSQDPVIKKYKENVIDPNNRDKVINIIRNFEYREPQESIYSDLKEFINQRYQEAGDLSDLNERMLFWVNDKIYDQDKRKLKIYEMSQNSFINYIYPNKKLVLALEEDITDEDYEKTKNSNFLKQLNLIEHPDSLKIEDHKAFLRWKNTKTQEEKKGKFTKIEFDKTYKSIRKQWEFDRNYIYNVVCKSETDVNKGQRLYYKSLEQEVQLGNVPFDDNKLDVARGVCNYLANHNPNNPFSIGWHPNYDVVLKREDIVE